MDRNKQMAKESQESIALFSTKIKPTLCPSLFGQHAPNVFFFLFIFFLFSKSSVVICQQPANPRNNRKTFFIWHLTFPPPFQETFVKLTKTKNPFTLCIFFNFFSPFSSLSLFFSLFTPLSGVIIKLLVPAKDL